MFARNRVQYMLLRFLPMLVGFKVTLGAKEVVKPIETFRKVLAGFLTRKTDRNLLKNNLRTPYLHPQARCIQVRPY